MEFNLQHIEIRTCFVVKGQESRTTCRTIQREGFILLAYVSTAPGFAGLALTCHGTVSQSALNNPFMGGISLLLLITTVVMPGLKLQETV